MEKSIENEVDILTFNQPENSAFEGNDQPTALTRAYDESFPPVERKKKKVIRKKKRPARPQVDPSTMKSEPPPQTGTIFNIWYNKWSGGDREDKYLSQTAALGRCNIAKDSGYTKADQVNGSYFCLFFARGVCPKGQECEYLHRLPGIHDMFNPNIDVFGRDKHSDYRHDMGGVGSFMRQNRTIYVGRIHVTDDIEEVVSRHFAEWGQVERSKTFKCCALGFVVNMMYSSCPEYSRSCIYHVFKRGKRAICQGSNGPSIFGPQ